MLDLKLPNPEWDLDINTDHDRLLQIMNNLVSNALKFTTEGYITISIAADGATKEGDAFKITVEDTGVGIETERKEKLMTKFDKVEIN